MSLSVPAEPHGAKARIADCASVSDTAKIRGKLPIVGVACRSGVAQEISI